MENYTEDYFDNLINCNHYFYGKLMAKILKGTIYMINKNEGYFYNKKKKLWLKSDKSDLCWYIAPLATNKLEEASKLLFEKMNGYCGYTKLYKKIPSSKIRVGSVKFVESVFKALKSHLFDENFENKLNKIEHLLPIKNNKVINLKTLEILPRTKNHFFSFALNCEFLKNNKLQKANKFFLEIMNNNKENCDFLQKCLGYCITGCMKARCFFIFYGSGSNGKSSLTEMLKIILNKFYSTGDHKIFIDNTTNGSATPHLMVLKNSRLITMAEPNKEFKLNDTILKAITGGDSISCRQIYCEQIEIKPMAKCIMLTNNLPKWDIFDQAMRDRIKYIPFDARFVKNPKKKEYLKDPEFIDELNTKYINQIFTWLCFGAQKYYKEYHLNPPKSILDAEKKYIEQIDIVQKFLNENCTITLSDNDNISITDLKNNFGSFCEENDCKMSKLKFHKTMVEEKHFKVKWKKRERCYLGLKYINCEDEEDEIEVSLLDF